MREASSQIEIKKVTNNDIEFRARSEIDIRFQYDYIWSEYRAEFEFRAISILALYVSVKYDDIEYWDEISSKNLR